MKDKERNCEIIVDGKKREMSVFILGELFEWARKRGNVNVKIEEVTFCIPEIKKHIHMVVKFRPGMLYLTTALAPEEAEIIKKTHPELRRFFAFI